MWVVLHIQADLASKVVIGMLQHGLAQGFHLLRSAIEDVSLFAVDELHVSFAPCLSLILSLSLSLSLSLTCDVRYVAM